MVKPKSAADLLPAFDKVGTGDWATEFEALLNNFDVPLPDPTSPRGLTDVEKKLGTTLPVELKRFYERFGPVDFDGNRLLDAGEFEWLADSWVFKMLSRTDRAKAKEWVVFAKNCADDPIAFHVATGNVSLVSHDPAGFEGRLASFSDFIKLGMIGFPTSYYGWPDEYLLEVQAEAQRQLFGQKIYW